MTIRINKNKAKNIILREMINQTITLMLSEQLVTPPQYPSATGADPSASAANALDPNAPVPDPNAVDPTTGLPMDPSAMPTDPATGGADPMASMGGISGGGMAAGGGGGFGGDMSMGGSDEPVPGADGEDTDGEEEDGSEEAIPEDPYQGVVDKVKETMETDTTKNPNLLINVAKSFLQKFGLLEPNKVQDAKSVVQKLRDENIPDLNNVADSIEKFLA